MAPQEACIRVGDVFAMLVEHKHGQGQLTQAHLLLRKMRERGLVLAPYIDSKASECTVGCVVWWP